MSIKVDISKQLNDISRFFNTADYTLFYQAVGNLLENAVADQFESSGAYFQKGLPWAPLKQSTIKQRRRLGYDSTSILRRQSGNAGLLGSFVSTFYKTSGIVSVGTNLFYAPYLHFGTRFMPERIIFPDDKYGLPPDIIEDIKDAFENFIAIKLGR